MADQTLAAERVAFVRLHERRTHASRLNRAVQWSALTVWPAGGQRQARCNAWIGNVDDDGYAVPTPRRPGPPTQRERRTFSGKAP